MILNFILKVIKEATTKMNKQKQLAKIYRDIKEIKIQGATNIAKSALEAYSILQTKSTIRKLISLRPTEPMLQNVLAKLDKKEDKNKILNHFQEAQDKINKEVLNLIKNKDIIFTHCHSTNVVKALIYAHKKGKKFEVYNTETRPLFQGRKTARELSSAGINVTQFVDSAILIAMKKTDKVFLGADAILKNGDVVNKVGSGMISEIAKDNKIPVYIIADSWKFTKKNIELEQRNPGEIWDNVPKNIKIKNPAFEKVQGENIRAIVSELGVLTPREFLRRVGG